MKDIAIKLTGVLKKYIVHHEKPTLVERILNGKTEEFSALKKINLEIRKGERVGLIGPNGSGKTTLLKIITGIAAPTKGDIDTFGRIVSLIDLEAGFHPDLTGIQNIYLNGMLLGMKNGEIKRKLKDIITFAGIGKFIDAQLFTYSQGMKLRLGFAVAVHANPDILILDENISVGDQEFGKLSSAKIQEFLKQGKTVLIASHNLGFIRTSCKRVIWMDKGTIKMDGSSKKVISKYLSTIKD